MWLAWKSKPKFQVGDNVVVDLDIKESGVITKPWQGDRYDWWVDITFEYKQTTYVNSSPYREAELKHDKISSI